MAAPVAKVAAKPADLSNVGILHVPCANRRFASKHLSGSDAYELVFINRIDPQEKNQGETDEKAELKQKILDWLALRKQESAFDRLVDLFIADAHADTAQFNRILGAHKAAIDGMRKKE